MSAGSASVGVDLASVRDAARLLKGRIVETPMLPSPSLSEMTGGDLWLKFENFQVTGSFKDRGALVKLSTLDEEARKRGVVAVSRGNHAQAVAYHSGRLGVPSTIVMPRSTPSVKVERTEHHGAEVVLAGASLEEAAREAARLASVRGLTVVHPYDDMDVIRGQGTVALEMLAAVDDLDALVVPVGGGGLISGIAIAAKALRPELRIFGVESARYPSMKQKLAGEPVDCGTATLADGIAVKEPGRLTLPIIRAHVDEILLVEEHSIEHAIDQLVEFEKTVVEGAGAAGLAALFAHAERFAGLRIGVVLSGGNIDPLVIARVLERGLVRTGRLVRYRVVLPDQPAALARLVALVAAEDANVVEISHQRRFTRLALESAEVELMLECRGREHADRVSVAFEAAGYPTSMSVP